MGKIEKIIEWALDPTSQVSPAITAKGIMKLASTDMESIFYALEQGYDVLAFDKYQGKLRFNKHPGAYTYRVPEVLVPPGLRFPKPLTRKPKMGDMYYEIDLTSNNVYEREWHDNKGDNKVLSARLAHSTENAALTHLKVLQIVNGSNTKD
jgi:hypothetical protein